MQTGVTNNKDITFRNNILADSVMQASIVFSAVKFYNNTFYRCNVGGNTLLQFAWYDPSDPTVQPRGVAYGGQVLNNAFVECNTSSFPGCTQAGVTWDGNRWVTWTNPSPPLDLVSDYNYTGGPNGEPKTTFNEPHGINGGSAGFVAAPESNCRLMASSRQVSYLDEGAPQGGCISPPALQAGFFNIMRIEMLDILSISCLALFPLPCHTPMTLLCSARRHARSKC